MAAELPRRVALVLDGNGWPSRVVARSLGSAGWRVIAPAHTKAARSRYCSEVVRLPDYRKHASAFAATVAETIDRRGVTLVSPAEDASLELLYETPGLLQGARVLGGDEPSAALATDKVKTLAAAREHGFPTPRSVVPEDVAEAVAAARDIGFPCAVKPRRSYGRLGDTRPYARHTVVHSPEETRAAVERYLARGWELPIVQAWTPGRSIGVGVVVRGGRILAWGAREAYRQWPIAGGVAVWRRTVGPAEPGIADVLRFFGEIGFEGLGDLQYHIDAEGTPRLMELGARVYGWLPLTALAGADLPLVAARSFEGHEPEETIVARSGVEMRWIVGELNRLWEAMHPSVSLPPGMRRRDVFRQAWPLWRPSMHYDGFGLGD
ncbi:MAG TPA: ATP-grasp domain-containing protein [Gaiellaceae bacterium]|nr:ATP-grasp domain-containing protein [Gaiellaceae bacterium]